jgi:hypothetical protein
MPRSDIMETNIKIRNAENGYIVAVGGSVFSKGKEYIAKDMKEIQDIVGSEIGMRENKKK